jgi:hypothetical protein
MKIRVIRAADTATGQPILAKVSEDRYQTIYAGFARIKDTLFDGTSFKAITGRAMQTQDAQEALVFLVSQLTYEETELQARYYQPMQYKDFVPISYAAGPYVDSITYYVYDKVAKAQFTSAASNAIEYSDVGIAQKTFGVHNATAGYRYTQDELRKSAYLKRPLPELRMATAMEAFERLTNEVMLLGNTAKNLTGLYNNASVSHATTPSTKKWDGSDATPITFLQLNSDFNFGLYTAWVASGYNVVPNSVVIPAGAYQYMATTPASTSIPDQTILDFVSVHNLYTQKYKRPLFIDSGYDLATAGSGNTGRTVFYDKNPTTLVGHIPMPLTFLAPQYDGIEVKIPGEGKLSGVEVKRVTNMYYMDGIV